MKNNWLDNIGKKKFQTGGTGYTYPESWDAKIQASESGNKKYYTPYDDGKGNMTIGDGFNLNGVGAKDSITSIGLDYDKVLSGITPINDDHIDMLRKNAIQEKYDDIRRRMPNVTDEDALYSTMDLAYQFGAEGIKNNFPGYYEAVNSKTPMKALDILRAGVDKQGVPFYDQYKNRFDERVKGIINYDKKLNAENPLSY